jgi:uncharacterized membrane protein YjdF
LIKISAQATGLAAPSTILAGDIWDAQKDILMDIVGGCVYGLLALFSQRYWRG